LKSLAYFLKKHWRVITFVVVLILISIMLWQFINVLLPFLVGLILSFLLLPVVRWLENHIPDLKKHPETKRVLIIICIYIIGLIILAALLFYLLIVINSSAALLWQNLPDLVNRLIAQIQDYLAQIRLQIPASLLEQYDSAISSAGVLLLNTLKNGLGQGLSLALTSASLILGFLSLPLIVFFMLKDWENLRNGFFSAIPSWARDNAKNTAKIVENVLGRYLRGQIIMSLIIGLFSLAMLTILQIPFAPALALWAALMEFIPILGFWLSIGAGVTIVIATDPSKVIWIIIGYVFIQLLENNLLVPRIQGKVMKLNPIFIILASVIGAYFGGLIGFIIAVPITATIIELFKYFKNLAQNS
jgi:predicted PurR-regulated permease PerM